MIQLDNYLYELLIEEDMDQYDCLTDWEREFIGSIRLQAEKNGGEVTEKQFDIIIKIAEKIEEEGGKKYGYS